MALTNLIDLLRQIGLLSWTFLDSKNYDYLHSVADVYHLGSALTNVLLTGAFAIEAHTVLLLWRALLRFGPAKTGLRGALYAVRWSVVVWTLFIVAVEFFVAYQSESVFREVFALTIGTALALVLIPDDVDV